MEFLKSSELELNPAGYLISKESKKPVSHEVFVSQQRAAEYIVKLSEAIKDKNFVASKVDDINVIKAEVKAAINATKEVSYVKEPTKPVNDINEQLVKFALDFVGYEDEKTKSSKINEFMQQFNVINDVETVGEYFTEKLVKLNKLYSISEILEAVKINVTKLD